MSGTGNYLHMTKGCVVVCSNPNRANTFLTSVNYRDCLWGPQGLLLNWYHLFFSAGKQSRCDIDHSPSYLLTFIQHLGHKQFLNYTTSPAVYLHSLKRENCTFYLYQVTECFHNAQSTSSYSYC